MSAAAATFATGQRARGTVCRMLAYCGAMWKPSTIIERRQSAIASAKAVVSSSSDVKAKLTTTATSGCDADQRARVAARAPAVGDEASERRAHTLPGTAETDETASYASARPGHVVTK